jgi:hypothetical protein
VEGEHVVPGDLSALWRERADYLNEYGDPNSALASAAKRINRLAEAWRNIIPPGLEALDNQFVLASRGKNARR